MNLLIGNYNNYFNRTKKIPGNGALIDYQAAMEELSESPLPLSIQNVNFNPADGINTTVIVGKGEANYISFDTYKAPDYLVCYGSNNTVVSRWFILDMNRTRGGQWELTLKRDVLVDYAEPIDTAPIYVEKGVINDLNNPLLCNNEGLTVNQIKKEEILLKDNSQCPWLVMYLKKGVLGSSSTVGEITIDTNESDANVYETIGTPIGQWSMYQYTTTDYKALWGANFFVNWTKTNTINDYRYKVGPEGSEINYVVGTEYTSNLRANPSKSTLDAQYKYHLTDLENSLIQGLGWHREEDIKRYDGKLIKDSTGKYYRVYVAYAKEVNPFISTGTKWLTSAYLPTLKAYMGTLWNTATGQSVSSFNDSVFQINAKAWLYRLNIVEEPALGVKLDFRDYTGQGTTDCPLYDIICMPYGTVEFTSPGSWLHRPTDTKETSMSIMNHIARQLSSEYVLDFQILPYCPCNYLTIGAPSGSYPAYIQVIGNESAAGIWTHPSQSSLAQQVILVANSASITLDINQSITFDNFNTGNPESDIARFKYINDCTSLRLCSPNYNGLFEMNFAKNGCVIDKFNVDMTMKPYTPYIHVNPNFRFLYGRDFDDCRGLLCGGDFSLGMINDAWAQYEIQNKNYQAIFDRQIQNMDVNNSINRQEQAVKSVTGSITGAASGAVAGGMATGSPWGAAAGAVIGGVGGIVGGVLDYQNLEKKINENRNYAIDNFNLSLGNIKALPYSITKTSALTANNKLFPFVEIYECSEQERDAYYLKLKYDGMSVGKIDYITNYHFDGELSYFKGEVIKIPDLADDTHVASAIHDEIKKGVYI